LNQSFIQFVLFILVPNVSILPAKKLAHLTLAHGLSSIFNLSMDQRASLIQLARVCIDFDRSVNWSLRLYSREKSSMNEVRSFIYRIKEYIYIFLF
jgi:hypothetical protein